MTVVGTKNKLTRDKWLEKTLKALPSGLRILDAGAGELANKTWCSHLKYVAQDFGCYDGKGNNSGLQMGKWDNSRVDIVSDITKIPSPDGSFDVVLCTEVFEHLPEPILAIREFRRLLKEGGLLILTAPFCSLTHFAPYHYYSGFNRYFYEKCFDENGFHILEITANGNYFEYMAQEIRRVPNIAEQYCNMKTVRWFRLATEIMLKWLGRFSSVDQGSSDLLCFGYHIKAIKQK